MTHMTRIANPIQTSRAIPTMRTRNAKTVLIVEDEKDLSDLIAYNLQRNGYEVLTAAEGLSAMDLAGKHLPDLVLLDLMLPGIDGTEVARRLRGDSRTANTP